MKRVTDASVNTRPSCPKQRRRVARNATSNSSTQYTQAHGQTNPRLGRPNHSTSDPPPQMTTKHLQKTRIGRPHLTCRPRFTARLPAPSCFHLRLPGANHGREPRWGLRRYSESGIQCACQQALRSMKVLGSLHPCGSSGQTSRKERRPTCSSGYIGFNGQSNFLAYVREGNTPT